MDCIEAHWNRRSASYDDFVVKGFSDLRERRAWQEHFSSILGTEPLNILDVGCGPGIVSMQLADLGHRVTSVDLSDGMLECARRNAADNGLDIDFRKGDAMCLDFPDSSFDAVVSDYMLWTVPEPRRVISEWRRVLRDDGILAYTDGDWFNDPLSTPMRCRVSNAFLRIVGSKQEDEPDHDEFEETTLWSRTASRPRDDLRMLEDAGFRDIRVIGDVQRKVLHGMRYYAYGLTNSHFTIAARK
ncbi:MAG: methyltransferase domain-containing protein [Thermoplasmata archaeon]|nr:methyltransferase domain-containing protein [Thermoplasmata archaeon]